MGFCRAIASRAASRTPVRLSSREQLYCPDASVRGPKSRRLTARRERPALETFRSSATEPLNSREGFIPQEAWDGAAVHLSNYRVNHVVAVENGQFSVISLSLDWGIHLIEITLYQAMFQRGPFRSSRLPNRRHGGSQHRHLQNDDPDCGGNVMDNQVPKYFTRARASFLLGMPEAELNRISKESGLGQVERAGNQKETYFTYEELQRISLLAAGQMETVP